MAVSFTPGAYSVQPTGYNYVSTYDIVKKAVDPKLVMRFGDEYLTELLGVLGREVEVENILYSHFENDRLMPKLKVAVAAGGASPQTLSVAATSPTQNIGWSQSSPYIGTALTGQGMPVRKGDLLLIPDTSSTVNASNYVRAYVESVNLAAGTFVIYSLDGVAIPAIAANSEIIIYSNMHGEGSNQPRSIDRRVFEYTNNTQIFKDTYEWTGTVGSIALWLDGENKFWTPMGEENGIKRCLNWIEMGLILGEGVTDTTLADLYGQTPVKSTTGLIPEVLAKGTVQNYSTLTGYNIDYLKALTEELDQQGGSMENWMFLGIKLSGQFDQNLVDYFKNGAVTYASFQGGKDFAINIGFKSLTFNNYTFHKRIYKAFNSPQMMGAVGYSFNQEGIVVPADVATDSKSGEKISSVRVRTLKGRGMRSEFVDLFKQGDDGQDKLQIRYIAEKGMEVFAANRFAYIQVQ